MEKKKVWLRNRETKRREFLSPSYMPAIVGFQSSGSLNLACVLQVGRRSLQARHGSRGSLHLGRRQICRAVCADQAICPDG